MWKTIVLVLFLIYFVDGASFFGRCLLYMKQCVSHCPRNMHPYHTRCDTDALSQRTCAFPDPYELGFTCGWSRCDCNGDLVMDDDGVCIKYEYCSGVNLKRRNIEKRLGKKRKSKRIRFKEDDEFEMN